MTVGIGCLAFVLAGANAARADHIDNELRTKAILIMKDLEGHGYKNVGILKFQVKIGNTPPTLSAGKLNDVMATRLENALVMVDKADAPIGLTRGAGAVAAAKDKNASFVTLEDRQKLFNNQYPLAWGNKNVTVDGFLSGIVEIAPDMKTTKITIKAFDKNNPDWRDVLDFTVDTDLAILRDTNQNFVVSRRTFNAWANAEDPDEELNKIVVKEAAKPVVQENNQPKTSNLSLNEMKEYLDFAVLFDGKPAKISSDGSMKKPKEGQAVLIKLNAKVKLGLLLRVNGINTLNEQSDEKPNLNHYNWWVLEPGMDYIIRGYYSKGKVKSFLTKAANEVDIASDFGEKADRHGKIDIDIFVDPVVEVKGATPKVRKPDFTFRTVTIQADIFDQLKAKIREGMPAKNKPVERSFIVGGAVDNQILETTSYDGRHVGGLTINYRKE